MTLQENYKMHEQIGYDKGEMDAKLKGASNLLNSGKLSVDEIANILELPLETVTALLEEKTQ